MWHCTHLNEEMGTVMVREVQCMGGIACGLFRLLIGFYHAFIILLVNCCIYFEYFKIWLHVTVVKNCCLNV